MKRDRIIIFSLVGIMMFSAVAIALPFVFSQTPGQNQDLADTDTTQPLVCQASAEVAAQAGRPEGDWPATASSPLEELQILDLRAGQGEAAQLGNCITVHYRLSLADGTPVEGNDTFSSGQPIAFELVSGGLIEGWIQGIPGLKEGGFRRLLVPAELAYGDSQRSGIPAGSDLIFDVELVKIEF